MKKTTLLNFLVLASVLGIMVWRLYPKKKPVILPKYGSYLSCQGHAFDLNFKHQGEVYLLKKALPSDPEALERLKWSAVYYQNMYNFNSLIYNYPNSEIKSISLANSPVDIKILKVEDFPYPLHIKFDPATPTELPPEQHAYMAKIKELGAEVQKGEPAIKISYNYSANILACLTVNDSAAIKKYKILHPIDPHLAYFFVPKHQWVSFDSKISGTQVANPCIDQSFVDNGPIDSQALWYFWRPFAKGKDSAGFAYDCSLYYQEGKNIVSPIYQLAENPPKKASDPNYARFADIKRPLRVSLFLGAFENIQFRPFDEDFREVVDKFLEPMSFKEAQSLIPERNRYDVGSVRLLIILWNLSQHMDLKGHDISWDPLSYNIVVKGKLRLSKKDMEVRLFFSPNKPKHPGYERFNEEFAKDFYTRDILVYEGHASLGSVFDLPKLTAARKEVSDPVSYQIFGIYSCLAQYYYDPAKFPRPEIPGYNREVIQTANVYSDVGKGALGILASVDEYLYNQSYVPFAFWASSFKSDNFFVLTNQ
jgi:hypothetical protein